MTWDLYLHKDILSYFVDCYPYETLAVLVKVT